MEGLDSHGNVRIILKSISEEYGVRGRIGFMWLMVRG